MIFSISDLHLDYTGKKSMDLFGDNWRNYEQKIFSNWKKIVKKEDIVLVAGDISWAMNIEEAYNDLIRIDKLPGTKIMIKGNHDYWWSSLSKNNKLNLKSINFLQNNSFEYENILIVGTRGWEDSNEESDNYKVYKRELLRLELSIKSANKNNKKIAMIHYPPFDRYKEPNEFHYMMKEYNISKCVYGHLHGPGLVNVVEGIIDGIEYICTSCDYIDFIPKNIEF
ncbi:metallophosphoesterase [Miniphocaeibacter massiliensis]|uniref:metallophosphoesterase n=1 Tax=Miniphocaeibacter massiliensis TaxID=2041841 RepID=UPI000C08B8E0|nr:metallophosphoesterase [Miniphocaeibacter massiliensis]